MKIIIIRLLLALFSLLIVGACSSQRIGVNQTGGLTLDNGDEKVVIQGHAVNVRSLNFGSAAAINQSVFQLKDYDYLLIVEKVNVDPQYEINHASERTVGIVFDAKRAEKLCGNNAFAFFQLHLKDGKAVNLLAQNFTDQYMTLVYGFDNTLFLDLASHICSTVSDTVKLTDHPILYKSADTPPLSNWSLSK